MVVMRKEPANVRASGEVSGETRLGGCYKLKV